MSPFSLFLSGFLSRDAFAYWTLVFAVFHVRDVFIAVVHRATTDVIAGICVSLSFSIFVLLILTATILITPYTGLQIVSNTSCSSLNTVINWNVLQLKSKHTTAHDLKQAVDSTNINLNVMVQQVPCRKSGSLKNVPTLIHISCMTRRDYVLSNTKLFFLTNVLYAPLLVLPAVKSTRSPNYSSFELPNLYFRFGSSPLFCSLIIIITIIIIVVLLN